MSVLNIFLRYKIPSMCVNVCETRLLRIKASEGTPTAQLLPAITSTSVPDEIALMALVGRCGAPAILRRTRTEPRREGSSEVTRLPHSCEHLEQSNIQKSGCDNYRGHWCRITQGVLSCIRSNNFSPCHVTRTEETKNHLKSRDWLEKRKRSRY